MYLYVCKCMHVNMYACEGVKSRLESVVPDKVRAFVCMYMYACEAQVPDKVRVCVCMYMYACEQCSSP